MEAQRTRISVEKVEGFQRFNTDVNLLNSEGSIEIYRFASQPSRRCPYYTVEGSR